MDEKMLWADDADDLCIGNVVVPVPLDRYEDLIRAETERDVLEAVITGDSAYNIDAVMAAIKTARGEVLESDTKPEGGADAE